MADIEQQTPVAETPVEDVEMEEGAGAGAGDAPGEEAGLTEMEPEPETPKLVLFAE